VQPLVLCFHVASELATLDLPTGYVILDLEQAVGVGESPFDCAGHAALLLHWL
jgi:hypothetical protein